MGSLGAPQIVFVDFQHLRTLVSLCNYVIWVYFKVLKMNLRFTFPWNVPKAHSLKNGFEVSKS